jgi:hypothetical protein
MAFVNRQGAAGTLAAMKSSRPSSPDISNLSARVDSHDGMLAGLHSRVTALEHPEPDADESGMGDADKDGD